MTTKGFYRTAGFFGILSAAGFLWFWTGLLLITLSRGDVPFEALLSGEATAGRLAVLSQHPWWRIVHAGQGAGVLAGLLFVATMLVSRREKLPALSFLSGLAVLAGLGVFAGSAFAEAILWPPMALTAPALLDVSFGPVYSDPLFLMTLVAGSGTFAGGSFLFGLLILRRESLPGALLYALGALAYGLGFLAGPYAWGIRTLGLILYAAGLIILSTRLLGRKGLLISVE